VKNKLLISLIFLITSCSNVTGNDIASSTSIYLDSSISSSVNSEQIDKLAIDDLFKKTIEAERAKNGNLAMYNYLEKIYPSSVNNIRRKAIYHMSLNPKLDEYLSNPYIKDKMDVIMVDQLKVFIPEDENKGFLIPYIIMLPEEKYKSENINNKQYMFFEFSNQPPSNIPWGSFNQVMRKANQNYALDNIPNLLYSPKVLTIQPQPLLRKISINEFNFARLLNRVSILAITEDYNDYEVFNWGSAINDYANVFNEYIYRQHLNVVDQSKNIIQHSQQIIRSIGYKVEDKLFMSGFSGSGGFSERFSTIYPELFKAVYFGGNIPITIPQSSIDDKKMLFPFGIYDLKELFNVDFELAKFNQVARLESIGELENWDNYPVDILDNVSKTYNSNFGGNGPSQWLSANQYFYSAGGHKAAIFNKVTGHDISKNDEAVILEFFKNNRDSSTPWYPSKSSFSEHIIFSHDNLGPLNDLIIKFPVRNKLPYYEGKLLLFTSLSGAQTGGPHSDAVQKRFQDQINLTQTLYNQSLLTDHNVFIVVYDTTMRSRLNLNDLKINITINPGEVVSTVNTDNKRVIVIYPAVDADGVKMIEELPSSITSVDQRYKR
jgi:hypothetical protein